MQTFNWCFIGAGGLAKKVAGQILKSGRHKIVSVYTRNYNKCGIFAGQFGAAACKTADEAINFEGVDGVYIVTPHNAHCRYALAAIKAGKPVLVEKPFGVTVEEVEEVFALAREKKVYCAEAMWTWISPCANEVKRRICAGELGKITAFRGIFCVPNFGFSRVTDPLRAGGAILDLGVYPITYAYRLFGAPKDVTCEGKVEGGVDVCERVVLHYDGFDAECISRIKHTIFHDKVEICGTEGKIICPFFHESGRATGRGKHGKISIKTPSDYLYEFDVTADEIKKGRTESTFNSPEDTIAVMKIMCACLEKMGVKYDCE